MKASAAAPDNFILGPRWTGRGGVAGFGLGWFRRGVTRGIAEIKADLPGDILGHQLRRAASHFLVRDVGGVEGVGAVAARHRLAVAAQQNPGRGFLVAAQGAEFEFGVDGVVDADRRIVETDAARADGFGAGDAQCVGGRNRDPGGVEGVAYLGADDLALPVGDAFDLDARQFRRKRIVRVVGVDGAKAASAQEERRADDEASGGLGGKPRFDLPE